MLVYVLGMDGDPLDPTHPAKARILLKQKKAKVVRRLPFTIKLTYEIKNPKKQKYTLGVDTGFSKLGTAVINEKDEVVYLSLFNTNAFVFAKPNFNPFWYIHLLYFTNGLFRA